MRRSATRCQSSSTQRSPRTSPARPSLPGVATATCRARAHVRRRGRGPAARAGRARSPLTSGEAGLGTTTLVGEIARSAYRDGTRVQFGHGEEGLAMPYQLFAEALGHLVAHAPEPMRRARRRARRRDPPTHPRAGPVHRVRHGLPPVSERYRGVAWVVPGRAARGRGIAPRENTSGRAPGLRTGARLHGWCSAPPRRSRSRLLDQDRRGSRLSRGRGGSPQRCRSPSAPRRRRSRGRPSQRGRRWHRERSSWSTRSGCPSRQRP